MVELSDLDPYAVIVPLASTSARPFSPPARHASPLDFDLLQLDDPLSSHVAAEQQRRQSLSKSTEQKKRTVSPSRTLLRRSSTTAPSSNEAILFHPSSSPPASASLSAIRSSSSARIPHRPTPRHADTSFSDFQSAPSPSTSLDSNSKGKLGASIKQTWSSLKTTSRPALANLFAEPSSYFDEPNNERAASWPSSPQRYASPTERAKPPAITLRGVRAGLKSTLTEDLAEAVRLACLASTYISFKLEHRSDRRYRLENGSLLSGPSSIRSINMASPSARSTNECTVSKHPASWS